VAASGPFLFVGLTGPTCGSPEGAPASPVGQALGRRHLSENNDRELSGSMSILNPHIIRFGVRYD
jgi:hypothetical protein